MTPDVDDKRRQLFEEFTETRSSSARDALAESYLPLADYFAKRYADRSVELEDLRQVARLALVKALDRFDPSRDIRFSTFAGRTIDGELKRWFRDKGWAVRVPRSVQENSLALSAAQQEFEQLHARSPTVGDLASMMQLESEQVLEALDARANYRALSLDRPTGEGDAGTFGETLASKELALERSELRILVAQLLDTLDSRDQEIIRLRFFDDLSQADIAQRVGISQMHVSRLLRRSLESLQRTIRSSV